MLPDKSGVPVVVTMHPLCEPGQKIGLDPRLGMI
jgi:hypothetical protein